MKYEQIFIKSVKDIPEKYGHYITNFGYISFGGKKDYNRFIATANGKILWYLQPLPEQESKSADSIKYFVKKFMQSYEPDTFIPNKYGQYVYRSENGASGLNLVAFFEDLLEEYAQSHPEAREMPSIVVPTDEEMNQKAIDYAEQKEQHRINFTDYQKSESEIDFLRGYNAAVRDLIES